MLYGVENSQLTYMILKQLMKTIRWTKMKALQLLQQL